MRPIRCTLPAVCVALLLALGSLPAPAAAQEATAPRITGRVTARDDGAPIAGAIITVEGAPLTARTGDDGRFTLTGLSPGPQVLVTRRLGFAPARTSITVPLAGTLTVDITLGQSTLQLDELRVTADPVGRARGELGTASVIDRDAIANQVAASLQGVLELVPGVAIQPPGLDATTQFSLRALAGSGTGGQGFAGSSANDVGSAGTLIVLDGIPLSNNANLQTVGPRGDVVSPASTAGGGIDLRRIPAATLERVEVIRGIPSVRWGDLTQGAIIVDTRASAVAPEFAARFDPRTREGNVVGGRSYTDERQSLTLTANLANTRQPSTLSSASTTRGAAQIAHRLQLGGPTDARGGNASMPARFVFDTRVDWWQLRFDNPERVDIEPGRNSFTDDMGLRIGERARLALGGGVLEWTAALDVQRQETRETRLLSRATVPFTDRLTEGRTIGTFIEGSYLGAYSLNGAPRLLYSRLEWDRQRTVASGLGIAQLRAGAELRREWNGGAGYDFEIARPPQTSPFNGTRGFDRPRGFEDIPPLVTSALYADARATARFAGMFAEVQPGLRVDALHEGDWWTSGARATVVQPRIAAQLAVRPWARLRGGAGAVSKLPTVGQLFPARQFFDLVNVNRFTPDPRERLAVLTTFIRDPTNPDLGPSRGEKREFGIELDGGRRWGSVSLTWFDDVVREAIVVNRDPSGLLRDRYALADTGIGTGQPGRIIDPPIGADPVPIFIDRNVNGGTLGSRGVEYIIAFPEIPALRTRLEVIGATIESRFSTGERDYGSAGRLIEFQIDTGVRRVPYFDGVQSVAKRGIRTWRLVHHQPDLGLVITGVVQQRLGGERRLLGRTDSLSFLGFVNRAGELVPVPEAERTLPEYADLRAARRGVGASRFTDPDDWLMSLQVAKSIAGTGRLSFYVFNALDKLATFSGGAVRALPTTRFGAELTLPWNAVFGGDR